MFNYTVFTDGNDKIELKFNEYICKLAQKSLKEKDTFIIGLSGGSLATFFGKLKFPEVAQIEKWQVFLVDERVVPLDHVDSNYRTIRNAWQDGLKCNWHPILFEDDLEKVALNYENDVTKTFSQFNVNEFDLLLLGLGTDGHTASLFPNHPDFISNISTNKIVIPVKNSPKPPSMRISLSPLTIKNAKACAFVITASPNKATIVKAILKDHDLIYPPTIVAPHAQWFLDETSSKELI